MKAAIPVYESPRARQIARALATRDRQVSRLLDLEAFGRLVCARKGARAESELFGVPVDTVAMRGMWIGASVWVETNYGEIALAAWSARELGGPRLDAIARDLLHEVNTKAMQELRGQEGVDRRVSRYLLTEPSYKLLMDELVPFEGLRQRAMKPSSVRDLIEPIQPVGA